MLLPSEIDLRTTSRALLLEPATAVAANNRQRSTPARSRFAPGSHRSESGIKECNFTSSIARVTGYVHGLDSACMHVDNAPSFVYTRFLKRTSLMPLKMRNVT
jgi:hypothetical protein